ncbi:MAG: ABC transporter permease [Myxococcales bacterium]|nr:ABC transporter permease [Myxococcales bacterium]MCB9522364.1 ABC transporter permease [Myxococcales bacterium]
MSRALRLLLAAAGRTGGALVLLMGASFVIYITIRSAPGDAIDAISPMGTPPQVKARLLAEFGLDRDPLTGYFAWLFRSARGDFGDSLVVAAGESVMAVAWPAFKITLILSGLTLLASLALALLGALVLGRPAGRQQLLTGPLYVITSAPSFVQAVLLAQGLNWTIHRYWEQLNYETPPWYPIPIYTDSLMPYVFAGLALLLGDGLFMDFFNAIRAELEGLRDAQFIAAVKAKGARTWGHIARNMLVPLVSGYAARLPIVLGGVVIVEYIFTLEGAGYLLLEASRERDFPVVVGISVLFTATVIGSTLIADVLRTLVDPREVARGG